MGRKHFNRTVSVDVEIDLIDFDEDDLADHLRDCGYSVSRNDAACDLDEIHSVYDAVREHRTADALALLERLLWPKWRTPDACQAAFDKSFPKAAR